MCQVEHVRRPGRDVCVRSATPGTAVASLAAGVSLDGEDGEADDTSGDDGAGEGRDGGVDTAELKPAAHGSEEEGEGEADAEEHVVVGDLIGVLAVGKASFSLLLKRG